MPRVHHRGEGRDRRRCRRRARSKASSRNGFRLACQATVTSTDQDIAFAPLRRRPKILASFEEGASPASIDPAVVRDGDNVRLDGRVVDRFHGHVYGMAIDLGTTTIVIDLVDLADGRTIARSAFENPQRFGGSDVMSRISYDAATPGELQKAVVRAINGEIASLSQRFGFRRREIYEIAIGGNATMRDLLFGLDVQGIGQKPYKSLIEHEFRAGKRHSMAIEANAADLGILANRETRAYGLPLLASHVGGDVAADILALGLLDADPRPRMLVDIGTNTEVVIAHRGRIVCASCPAGPAFEGGGVEHGMAGYDGAIERVTVGADGAVAAVEVIGGGPPVGICGSGLVDLLAGLRAAGRLGPKGTFEGVPRGHKLPVAIDHGITLSRADVSHLAQAKAANTCGQLIVLRALGLDPGDIDVLHVAGGFANYLDLDHAVAIGFLAPVPRERIRRAGNAALAGVRHRLAVGCRPPAPRSSLPQRSSTSNSRRRRTSSRFSSRPAASSRCRRGSPACPAPLRRTYRKPPPMQKSPDRRFIIIGENIHTTRVLTQKSPRFKSVDGVDGLAFADVDGVDRFLPISDAIRKGQDYEEGRIKHLKLAVQTAMQADHQHQPAATAYIALLARLQESAGAAFLDINVDEISIKLADQKAAMAWLAGFVQQASRLPLSIDSSNLEVIAVGIAGCDADRQRPMLNSASLERIDALDLVANGKARVVVTAAGLKGMPAGVADRVENAGRMIEAARSKGIAAADIYIDPLIFPISVDKTFALHSLDAMRELRRLHGGDIHITGGFSNVSFGIPHRRAINDLYLKLAIDAGADSGIIDPVAHPPDKALAFDPQSRAYQLAEDVLLGRDEHCRNYIRAWRKGEI